jgi:hypothetical protein
MDEDVISELDYQDGNEKTRAAHVAGRVAFRLISICRAYCTDAIDVPEIEANLLVPKSIATER